MTNMQNGMIILEQTDTKQQAVFIDEEHLHYLKLKAMFNKRDNEKKIVDRNNSIVENRRKKWQHYTTKTFTFIGIRMMLVAITVLTMMANLVNPIVGIPVVLYCLVTACIRFGMWFSNWTNHNS